MVSHHVRQAVLTSNLNQYIELKRIHRHLVFNLFDLLPLCIAHICLCGHENVFDIQTLTYDAPSYRWPKASPTVRTGGKRRQHTRTEHDPDIPWHLQIRCMRDRSAC